MCVYVLAFDRDGQYRNFGRYRDYHNYCICINFACIHGGNVFIKVPVNVHV